MNWYKLVLQTMHALQEPKPEPDHPQNRHKLVQPTKANQSAMNIKIAIVPKITDFGANRYMYRYDTILVQLREYANSLVKTAKPNLYQNANDAHPWPWTTRRQTLVP